MIFKIFNEIFLPCFFNLEKHFPTYFPQTLSLIVTYLIRFNTVGKTVGITNSSCIMNNSTLEAGLRQLKDSTSRFGLQEN